MPKGEGKKSAVKTHGDNTKLALYRKYRPTSLDQVVGQPQVTEVLAAAAKNNSFAHAYLFTGQRGTGKTTVARILAHMVNGLDYNDNINSDNIDIIEIDAASNNGVDDVREIRDSVQLAPMNCSHKVYIIDEFHMLSKPAFNALLKTIEEPPEYVVFILATTELQKVPATILSRVQRFHFKPLPAELLAGHLRTIADAEKISVDNDALLLIAQAGGGSVRDSITLLDQLSSNPHITTELVNDVLGLVSNQQIDQLIDNVIAGDYVPIVSAAKNITADGTSADALAQQLIARLETRAIEQQQPSLYALIDSLLDVAKSTLPMAKLLAALICYNPKNVQVQATAQSMTPPARPSTPKPATGMTTTTATTPMTTTTSPASVDDADNSAETTPDITPTRTDADTENTASVEASVSSSSNADSGTASGDANQSIADLVWADVLQQLADQDRPSTLSLLQQCDYRYSPDNNTLTLYFGKAFHRKQAKAQTFNDTLLTTLDELYHTKPAIEISDESAPADSDVAAVLRVVGGEVTTITDGAI